MRALNFILIGALTGAAGSAVAADVTSHPQINQPANYSSPWSFEAGSRYWISSGNHAYDLYTAAPTSRIISRLTYGDLTGQSAELFFRVDHEAGLFFKGFVGGGSLAGGKLNDEDWVFRNVIYSNTVSSQSGGALKYVTIDTGFNLLKGELPSGQEFKIGPLVGYNNFHERMNNFGMWPGTGNANPEGFGSTAYDTLDMDAVWNSLRAGVGGEVVLLPGLRGSLEAAWTYNWLWSTDYHNLRPEIASTALTGKGGGLQLEGLFSYDLTTRFSIGVGGRYWRFNAIGLTQNTDSIEGIYTAAQLQPLQMRSERFGMFAQASYRFGGAKEKVSVPNTLQTFAKAEEAPHEWGGSYIGANVGYGFAATGVTTLSGGNVGALAYQSTGQIPFYQRSDISGFVAGGQIGYNLVLNSAVVLGAETDFGYANIGGSRGTTSYGAGFLYDEEKPEKKYYNAPTVSTKRVLRSLGTVRARVGILARDDFMIYGTGGFAYGSVAVRGAAGYSADDCNLVLCSYGSSSGIAAGWSAGAGLEYAVARNLTLKSEWLYVNLGNQNYTVSSYGASASLSQYVAKDPIILHASSDSATHLIRTGLNYRIDLGSAPIKAAY